MSLVSIRNKVVELLRRNSSLEYERSQYLGERADMLWRQLDFHPTAENLNLNDLSSSLSCIENATFNVSSNGSNLITRIFKFSFSSARSGFVVDEKLFYERYLTISVGSVNRYFAITYCRPEDVVSFVTKVVESSEMWNTDEWASFVLECRKRLMSNSLAETAVDVLVRQKLAGTGIAYHVEPQTTYVKVHFLIANQLDMEYQLARKTFIEQIDDVIKVVISVDELSRRLGKPFKVSKNINIYDKNFWILTDNTPES